MLVAAVGSIMANRKWPCLTRDSLAQTFELCKLRRDLINLFQLNINDHHLSPCYSASLA